MTTEEIARQLDSQELPSKRVRELRAAITQRRAAVNARLAEIEAERRATFDPARHVALNQEAEILDVEAGLIYELDERSFRLHERAIVREQFEGGTAALKRLPKLVEAAARAAAAFAEAKREIEDTLSAIGACRTQMSPEERESFFVEDEEADRIAALLNPGHRGSAIALRRMICKPAPPTYAESEPDYAEQVRSIAARARSPFERRGS